MPKVGTIVAHTFLPRSHLAPSCIMPKVGTIVAQSRDYCCPKSGLLLPKVGTIVAHTFFAMLLSQPVTRTSVPPTGLCISNKIYKINYVPARLTATGRLLESLSLQF